MNRFRSAAMALTVAAGLMLPGAALAETAPAPAAPKQESSMTDPKIAVVEKMIDAWNRRDWKLVGDLFAEDGVLHSMMIEPVNGRPAIAERIIRWREENGSFTSVDDLLSVPGIGDKMLASLRDLVTV